LSLSYEKSQIGKLQLSETLYNHWVILKEVRILVRLVYKLFYQLIKAIELSETFDSRITCHKLAVRKTIEKGVDITHLQLFISVFDLIY
jgi:hypothetical protein